MEIFVMRHGEAEIFAQSDDQRHLTLRGKSQSYSQGLWLKNEFFHFDKVIVSPYIRAIETFEEINRAFENTLKNNQEIWQGLTPDSYPSLVTDYLQTLEAKRVLLISHLPLVSEIVAEICGKSGINYYPATIGHIHWNLQHKGKLIQAKYPE